MSNDNLGCPDWQNDPFGEDFFLLPFSEELEERAETMRQDNENAIRHFVELLAWETMDNSELRNVVISFLWCWDDIELSWMAEAFFYDVRQVCEIAEAHPLKDFYCLDCGTQLHVRDRRHLMRLDRSLKAICSGEIEDHFIDLLCDVCKDQRAEIDEEQRRTRAIVHQARLAEIRKRPYAEHLRSEEWQVLRRRLLRKVDYRCQLCGSSNVQLNVHHNTYANYGEERLEDLIVLCRLCHQHFHSVEDAS